VLRGINGKLVFVVSDGSIAAQDDVLQRFFSGQRVRRHGADLLAVGP
jgi:hypothetical protein